MVGNIGMLRNPGAGTVDKSVEYAFTLVAGWNKKDRGEIGAALKELKEVAANNEELFRKAGERIAELSKAEKLNRDLLAKAEQAKAEADAAMQKSAEEVAAAKARIEAMERNLNERIKTFKAETKVANDALADRIAEVTKRERAVKRVEAALAKREANLDEAEQKAAKLVDTFQKKIAAIQNIANG